jgi:hypothetical protein
MSPERGQVRHQNKKVDEVAGKDRDELFEESTEHASIWTPEAAVLMPGERQLAVGNWQLALRNLGFVFHSFAKGGERAGVAGQSAVLSGLRFWSYGSQR